LDLLTNEAVDAVGFYKIVHHIECRYTYWEMYKTGNSQSTNVMQQRSQKR